MSSPALSSGIHPSSQGPVGFLNSAHALPGVMTNPANEVALAPSTCEFPSGSDSPKLLSPLALPPSASSGSPTAISCSCSTGPDGVHPHSPSVKFTGVRQRGSGRWVAEIKDNIRGVRRWLGTYSCPVEAAHAFDGASRALRGPRARTNFTLPSEESAKETPVSATQQPAGKQQPMSGKETVGGSLRLHLAGQTTVIAPKPIRAGIRLDSSQPALLHLPASLSVNKVGSLPRSLPPLLMSSPPAYMERPAKRARQSLALSLDGEEEGKEEQAFATAAASAGTGVRGAFSPVSPTPLSFPLDGPAPQQPSRHLSFELGLPAGMSMGASQQQQVEEEHQQRRKPQWQQVRPVALLHMPAATAVASKGFVRMLGRASDEADAAHVRRGGNGEAEEEGEACLLGDEAPQSSASSEVCCDNEDSMKGVHRGGQGGGEGDNDAWCTLSLAGHDSPSAAISSSASGEGEGVTGGGASPAGWVQCESLWASCRSPSISQD